MPHWRKVIILLFPILTLLLFYIPQTGAQFTPGPQPTYEQRLLELVNQERWNNGRLPPLRGSASLEIAAKSHSQQMALRNFLDHCDFDTRSTFWQRIEQAGYSSWAVTGENIAAGHKTPEEVVAGWMQSQRHRANILSTDFWEVGSGYMYQADDGQDVRQSGSQNCRADSTTNGPYYYYWTQDFGRRSEVMPVIINREAFETNRREVALYLYGAGWAQAVRVRNENGLWSAWQPFSPELNWVLSSGSGLKMVFVEMSSGVNGAGTIRSASDSIWLRTAVPPTVVSSPHHLYLPVILDN
ncbi:MAG TPA: CAP domain-containing protein [Chloroflexota bacterium]|nr:CAP domain-containing protein [Chloroflexota bacterium]